MSKIVLDTSAWIEYFNGTEKGARVKERIAEEGVGVLITGMIVAELSVKFPKDSKPIDEMVFALKNMANVVSFDFELGKESAKIYMRQRRLKPKFGLMDARVVAAARLNGGKVITCDNDFSNINEAIVIR